MIEKETS